MTPITDSKPATQSVTLAGALVLYATAKISPLLTQFGVTDPQMQMQIVTQLMEIGAVLVAFGRANVTTRLRGGWR